MTDKLRQAAEMALEALEVATTPIPADRQEVLAAMNALRQALAEPSEKDKVDRDVLMYGQGFMKNGKHIPLENVIDRGAWADVENATKWVDELRGDEGSPNSTTDVVEPEPFGWLFKQTDGNLYKLLRGEDAEWSEKNNPYWVKVSPLYPAPPKREWQGLTMEDVAELRLKGAHSLSDKDAFAVDAKLKTKNT
jgi:hypothetical protein